MNLVLFLLSVVHFGWVYSTCTEYKSCGDCIGYAIQRCVWCAQDTMKSTQPNKQARCQQQTEVYKDGKLDTEWCPRNEVFDPDSEKANATENEPFSTKKGKVVQFRPQKINLTLRPGIPATIDMFYNPAKNFPLDMYFLMDNSANMRDYGKAIANQALKIYEKLNQLTNNVRLGIGSYVEKHALPYADPKQHTTPFQHHLSLTNDMNLFKQKVQYYKHPGSNYDSPEATLDALMQVMVCGDKIGWRTPLDKKEDRQSRRIIIVATAATFHSAGDGKLIGAYKPNDMKCHLNSDNIFDEKDSLTYDYPSISHINYVAKENNFRIIFAVHNTVKKVYDDLAAHMFAVNTVSLTDNKIIPIIMEAYNTASRELKLQLKNVPKFIKVKTDCDVDPTKCIITQKKPSLHIKAEITALDCTEHSNFEINPFGLSDDKLSINITVNCKCQCEGIPSTRSDKCNKAGVMECGLCKCDPDRSGETCETECSGKDYIELMSRCKEQTSDVARCSNHGKCVCGKCQCEKDFSGDLCQIDDAKCREECPADKGDCSFGKCVCKDSSMWTGPTCSCLVSTMKCVGPFSKQVCSGRGNCTCGRCDCNSINGVKGYFGPYCESCKDCAKEFCEDLKEYAQCIYEKNNKTDCDEKYTHLSVKEVKIMNKKDFDAGTTQTATGCRNKLPNDNIIVYKYKVIAGSDTEPATLELTIQDELETPPVANIWIAIGSVVGGTLLIGLLSLIIWMIATRIYDRRAYDKFCQEATDAGFDVTNPVYKDPYVRFVNPAFKANET